MTDIEHEAADQIRRMLTDDERFAAVSGTTSNRASPKRGWKDCAFFSFERGGKLYFVSVEPVED